MAQSRPEPTESRAFARMHPALCLAAGLFVSKSKSGQTPGSSTTRLAEYQTGDLVFVFEGHSPLGVEDLRALQAVFVLASRPGNSIEIDTAAPATPIGRALVDTLAPTTTQGEPAIAKMITTSLAGLATAGGYAESGGGGRAGIALSIERMSAITVICKRHQQEVSRSQLLASAKLDPETDKLGQPADTQALALAPCLSTTLLSGSTKNRYAHIEQAELVTLGQQAHSSRARLLHMRLCGFIDPGQQRNVSVEKLTEYAFGNTESADTLRRQYGDIRKTMPIFIELGWETQGDDRKGGKQVFSVTRPGLNKAKSRAK